ncbi:putative manganese-dependent inorganic diphosphatase [Maledivibacter halophilus]|uniref:inorganic diphosphatase n=1 Tax=Maledivibacter halophilus TaxID=36842 RepID=A0A1T5M7K8_9FIRM|nr:putative manganese-dependent inorganic diphosphatase [Maledivibacter halophilus]SKC84230.1 manganese-dependent inorganic pyrophosphatase [Maledivibacter halophilus]
MIYVFGHKNPDTDSVTSAIALSNLKNKLDCKSIPYILGKENKETKYVLEYFNVDSPKPLENIKTQIKDLNYDRVEGISSNHSILYAYKLMEEKRIRTLPIIDKNNKLIGIITMKDIAMGLIKGDFYHLKASLENIAKDLGGKVLVANNNEVEGKINIISYYGDTLKKEEILSKNSIVIVGDRYDIIDYALECGIELLIITGGKKLPDKYIDKAKRKNVNLILVKTDTYTTSKLISQCNYLSSIMIDSDIVKFNQNEYLDDIKEELINNKHSNYPIVTDKNEFLGFISRRHILNPNRKKVILVDHNEYSQSADGLDEAEILEIVDHHKIGDISTSMPITFRNMPLGSTCTIVFQMYKEYNIPIDRKMAGVLMSGIISDTLLLKSPTTTYFDKHAVNELNSILKMDVDNFAMEMFRAGTSLEGQSISEIFYKDFKEFRIHGNKVGVGQVFTLDIKDVLSRKEEFLEFINNIHKDKDNFVTLLLITDILKKGSYILFRSNNKGVIAKAFDVQPLQGIFVRDMVSRKKQVIPKLTEAINIIG